MPRTSAAPTSQMSPCHASYLVVCLETFDSFRRSSEGCRAGLHGKALAAAPHEVLPVMSERAGPPFFANGLKANKLLSFGIFKKPPFRSASES
mmetsp:Transcript_51674/g.96805  ORF Transcript_51674/g.96805 Transcript_51674/m.96805 type:complete len:93 (-) Transcript_51674:808-1086(-)